MRDSAAPTAGRAPGHDGAAKAGEPVAQTRTFAAALLGGHTAAGTFGEPVCNFRVTHLPSGTSWSVRRTLQEWMQLESQLSSEGVVTGEAPLTPSDSATGAAANLFFHQTMAALAGAGQGWWFGNGCHRRAGGVSGTTPTSVTRQRLIEHLQARLAELLDDDRLTRRSGVLQRFLGVQTPEVPSLVRISRLQVDSACAQSQDGDASLLEGTIEVHIADAYDLHRGGAASSSWPSHVQASVAAVILSVGDAAEELAPLCDYLVPAASPTHIVVRGLKPLGLYEFDVCTLNGVGRSGSVKIRALVPTRSALAQVRGPAPAPQANVAEIAAEAAAKAPLEAASEAPAEAAETAAVVQDAVLEAAEEPVVQEAAKETTEAAAEASVEEAPAEAVVEEVPAEAATVVAVVAEAVETLRHPPCDSVVVPPAESEEVLGFAPVVLGEALRDASDAPAPYAEPSAPASGAEEPTTELAAPLGADGAAGASAELRSSVEVLGDGPLAGAMEGRAAARGAAAWDSTVPEASSPEPSAGGGEAPTVPEASSPMALAGGRQASAVVEASSSDALVGEAPLGTDGIGGAPAEQHTSVEVLGDAPHVAEAREAARSAAASGSPLPEASTVPAALAGGGEASTVAEASSLDALVGEAAMWNGGVAGAPTEQHASFEVLGDAPRVAEEAARDAAAPDSPLPETSSPEALAEASPPDALAGGGVEDLPPARGGAQAQAELPQPSRVAADAEGGSPSGAPGRGDRFVGGHI